MTRRAPSTCTSNRGSTKHCERLLTPANNHRHRASDLDDRPREPRAAHRRRPRHRRRPPRGAARERAPVLRDLGPGHERGDLLMAFGFGGGGAMFGGSAVTTSSRAGLPFGGIPEELMDEATKLLATEPEHPKSHIHFTQLPSAKEREKLSAAPSPRGLPEVGRRWVPARDRDQPHVAGGAAPHGVRDTSRDGAPPRPHRHRRLCALVPRAGVRERVSPARAGRRHREAVVSSHARPSHQGLHPVPATEPRLLHRREGRRVDEPDDERHREPPAAHPRRHQPVRPPGSDDDRDHRHLVLDQRRTRGLDGADHRAAALGIFGVVPPRVRKGLPPRARPHRARACRPV